VQIAFLLFDRLTTLDAIGPYEVLQRLPGADVRFVAARPGGQRDEKGYTALVADHSLEDVTNPDVLVVPGGFGTRALMKDEQVLDWVRAVHSNTTWTTSVCTGSLVLAAAGILRDKPATTHWMALDILARHGAEPTSRRVVEVGKVITAAGVSAGIDMALVLADRIAGPEVAQAIQRRRRERLARRVTHVTGPPYFGGIRNAPSSRIVSPFSIAFSAM
jgi:transcriptional regulator GlxA family with amidase domain